MNCLPLPSPFVRFARVGVVSSSSIADLWHRYQGHLSQHCLVFWFAMELWVVLLFLSCWLVWIVNCLSIQRQRFLSSTFVSHHALKLVHFDVWVLTSFQLTYGKYVILFSMTKFCSDIFHTSLFWAYLDLLWLHCYDMHPTWCYHQDLPVWFCWWVLITWVLVHLSWLGLNSLVLKHINRTMLEGLHIPLFYLTHCWDTSGVM